MSNKIEIIDKVEFINKKESLSFIPTDRVMNHIDCSPKAGFFAYHYNYEYDNQVIYRLIKLTSKGWEAECYSIGQIGEDGNIQGDPLKNCLIFEDLSKTSWIIIDDLVDFMQVVDAMLSGLEVEPSAEVNENTALVSSNPQSVLEFAKQDLALMSDAMSNLRIGVDIRKKQATVKYETLLKAMSSKVTKFKKDIAKLEEIICKIEIYTGAVEEISQWLTGTPAKEDTPITIRQSIVYMDEAIALEFLSFDEWFGERIPLTTRKSFDWKDYDKGTFKDFILENERWKTVCPEERCIVAIKPRCRDKKYTDEPLYNWILNKPNHKTLFFIRNGENLYVLTSENINAIDKTLPGPNELSGWLKEAEEKHESLEEIIPNSYLRFMFLIQGLIDRSPVFKPHNLQTNVLKGNNEGINVIYDVDRTLGYKYQTYDEWKREKNSKIKKGSRIIWLSNCTDYHLYITTRYYTENSRPEAPNLGIYSIEETSWGHYSYRYQKSITEDVFVIKYVPGDDLWDWQTGVKSRRNSVAMRIAGGEYLCIDDLTLEEIDDMINNRLERPKYEQYLHTLITIKRIYLKEMESEELFITMLEQEAYRRHLTPLEGKNIKDVIKYYVDWYKGLLVWKSPISEREQGAYSMVARRLFSEKSIKVNFKKA